MIVNRILNCLIMMLMISKTPMINKKTKQKDNLKMRKKMRLILTMMNRMATSTMTPRKSKMRKLWMVMCL